nr:DciA family protein [Microbacterium amylolyticum]
MRLRGLPLSKAAQRRKRWRGEPDGSQPFAKGRDPQPLGDAIAALTTASGWTPQLEREEIALNWETIAGADNAAHSHIETFAQGLVVVRCDSTARSKQMHLLRSHVLTRIMELYPEAGVKEIRFFGPDVPTWKHGFRRVQGRGPRDTYG